MARTARSLLIGTAVTALVATAVPTAFAAPSGSVTLLVTAKQGASAHQVVARNGGAAGRAVDRLRLQAVTVPSGQASSYLSRYRSDSDVARVEVQRSRRAASVATDPGYGEQWALPQIGWESVHGSVTPAGTAILAVLDTGVSAGADVTQVPGWSAFGTDPASDGNGHGTALASIAAAATDNDTGIAGVAYAGVSVMPVQVLGADGTGTDADVIAGVVYAADHGADVILMGFSDPAYSQALQDAVDYAWSKGAVLVAATGNDGSTTSTYPAGDAHVVGVSATDSSDALASSSSSGEAAFLGAPGVGIATGTGSISGTSASAAVVAGAAAQLKANDGASNGVIVGRLARNADAAGSVSDTGNGRVNLARAIADTGTDPVDPVGTNGAADGGPVVGPYTTAAATLLPTATYSAANGTITAALPSPDPNQNKDYQFVLTPPSGSPQTSPCLRGVSSYTFTLPANYPTGTYTVSAARFNNKDDGLCDARVAGDGDGTVNVALSLTISGTALNDANGDGARNDGGSGVPATTLHLYRASSASQTSHGAGDTDLGTTPSNSLGNYGFTSLSSGTYFVTRANPAGWVSTNAIPAVGGAKVSNDELRVVLSGASSSTGSDFLAQQRSDLAISKSGPASATVNDAAGFDYILGVTNNGPAAQPIGAATVTDVLPAGVTFQTSGTDTRCSALGQTVTCSNTAVLASGASTSFTVHVVLANTVVNGQTLNNQASVSSTIADPVVANNTSNVVTTTAGALTTTTTGANKTATYGASSVTLTANVTSGSGTVNAGSVTFTVKSGATTIGAPVSGSVSAGAASASFSIPVGTGVATYAIETVYDGSGSFSGSSDLTKTLSITPKPASVTASDRTKTYGQTVTFDGTEFVASGFVNGDSVSSVTLASTGAAATAAVSGSPYAITPSNAVGSGLGNYIIGYLPGVLTVNPKTLTVTATDRGKTYGQTVTFDGTEFTTGAGQLVNGDTVDSVTLTSAGAAASATVAGSPYTITPSNAVGSGLDNYTIGYVDGTLTVAAKSLTITASDRTKTYGQTVTFDGTEFGTTGLTGSDSVTSVTLTSAGAAATAAVSGSPYTITPSAAVGSGLGNYTINYADGALTVNPKTLNITASDRTKTYGQTVTFAGTEFSTGAGDLVNGDAVESVTLASAGADPAAAITGGIPYAITPSNAVGSGLGNYTIGYLPGALTVNPKTLNITASDRTKTYGQTVTFDGTEFATGAGQLVNGDTVDSVTLLSDGADPAATVAGSPYAITPSNAVGSGLGNYTIGYVEGTLTVAAKSLTVTATDRAKTYGATVTFDGTEFGTTGLTGSDSVTSVTLTSAGAAATATVAGSPYTITPSNAVGSGLGNYSINYVDGALTVNPRTLTLTAASTAKTYGQTVSFDGTEFTPGAGQLVNGDTVDSVTLLSDGADPAATVAGSPYAITPSNAVGSGLGNYTIGYVDGALTVNPKALTVTAADRAKTYGQTVTFDGTEFTTGAGQLVNGDTVDSVTLTSAGAAASATVAGSPYTITPSNAVGSGLGNYTIGYVDGTLTVNPKTLTIAADNRAKTYGQTVTFDGTEFGTTGLTGSDSVTSVTLTSAGAAATATVTGGPYDITPSAAVGSGLENYTIAYVDGALTVNPKTLTVTATDRAKTYGATVSFAGTEFTTGPGELINGDAVDSVTLASAGAAPTAAVSGSPYAITPSNAVGSGLGNYTVGYLPGALTVNPKPLTVTALSTAKTYGATVTFAGTEFATGAGQLVNGDTVDSVTLTSAGAAAAAAVSGSPYAITPSNAVGSGLGNYTIGYVDGALTVNPKTLTVTAVNGSKTYGATVTFTGGEFATGAGQLVNGDTVDSVTLTSAGAAATATVAGSPYTITPSNAVGSGLGNYTIGYVDGTLTVNPKTLTVTATDRAKTYGATVSFAGTEFTTGPGQLVNGDTVSSVTLLSDGAAPSATVAGSPYAIVPSNAVGTGLGNYTIGYGNGTLTVNPKALTVTATDRAKTYGQTVTFAGTEFATGAGQLVNGDTVDSVTLSSAGAAASATVAGSPYPITPSAALGSGLGNYTIGYVDGALTVNPKTLTVTAVNGSKTYGATVTFTGGEFATGAGQLINGDTVSSVTLLSDGAAPSATVAGSPYSIVPSNAVGTGLGNYNVGYANGTLTVSAKAASVVADNKTKAYGDPNPPLTATVTGAVNGDVLKYTLATTATPTSVVGVYPITVTLGSNPNYTVAKTDGTLTVVRREAYVAYIGQTAFFTSGSSSTTAQVALSASVADPDGSGSVTNATVTFTDIGNGTPKVLASNVKVTPVSNSDSHTGTANAFVTLSTGQYGAQAYLIEVSLGGSYTNSQQTEADPSDPAYLAAHPTVTVLIPATAASMQGVASPELLGTAAGRYGDATDVDYTVGMKYTSKMTNAQGQIQLVLQRADGTYYVKSNSVTSMGFTNLQGGKAKDVTIYAKASIFKIYHGVTTSIEGNVTLRLDAHEGCVTNTDCTQSSGDRIAFTVLSSKDSSLFYSNNWQFASDTKSWRSMVQDLSGWRGVIIN